MSKRTRRSISNSKDYERSSKKSKSKSSSSLNSTKYRLRIHSLNQLVMINEHKETRRVGSAMNDPVILNDGTIIVDHSGKIAGVFSSSNIPTKFQGLTSSDFDQDINGSGKSLIPGFVDGHTHPVWSGDRVHEFKLKLSGASYMEIHKAGGGIGFTVDHTRASSEEELLSLYKQRLDRMLRFGTTAVEAKSGYGLETDTEMKMLRVIHKADQDHPIHIVSTFCGAHSIPKGSTASEATKDVIERQIPALVAQREAGQMNPTLIDVFVEKGVFEIEDSKAILKAGQDVGLEVNFHGDELYPLGGGELAGEIGALAASHLEFVSKAGIQAMSLRPTFAVLLPTTAYILRLVPPPARDLISGQVPVALGSDFNPNAYCYSMPMVMHLACILMKMSMNEALVAATINAAGSMGISDMHGSLEEGKWGNMILINAPQWEHIVYRLADADAVIEKVFIQGKTQFENKM